MAKLGIALGAGPRGRGVESPYSDQKSGDHVVVAGFFIIVGIRKARTGGHTGVKSARRNLFRNLP